jgi:hypothetical protein
VKMHKEIISSIKLFQNDKMINKNNDYKKENMKFSVSILYCFIIWLALVCQAVTVFYAMCVYKVIVSVHRTSAVKISEGHTDTKFKILVVKFSVGFIEVLKHTS